MLAKTEYRMSFTKVDLPDPLTPVTATKTAKGNVTSMSCKLFSLADFMVKTFFESILRRTFGISITDLPER